MISASFHHDLAGIRQDAMSGLGELQQSSCQGLNAALVHVSSFQVQFFDEGQLIEESFRHVGSFIQGAIYV